MIEKINFSLTLTCGWDFTFACETCFPQSHQEQIVRWQMNTRMKLNIAGILIYLRGNISQTFSHEKKNVHAIMLRLAQDTTTYHSFQNPRIT